MSYDPSSGDVVNEMPNDESFIHAAKEAEGSFGSTQEAVKVVDEVD